MTLATKYLPNYTIEDYQRWEGDWELIEGVPFAMSPPPTIRHQRVEGALFGQWLDAMERCGPCEVFSNLDWIVSESTVVRPDVLIASNVKSEDHLRETPKLIIEILSESTAHIDQQLKKEIYEENEVEHYIIVNAEKRSGEHFHLVDGKYRSKQLGEDDIFELSLEEKNCEIKINLAEIWPA